MQPISFKRHRFPPDVIRYAVWLYFRFTLSVRDVEELLAQRGIRQSGSDPLLGDQVRPLIGANLRRGRAVSVRARGVISWWRLRCCRGWG